MRYRWIGLKIKIGQRVDGYVERYKDMLRYICRWIGLKVDGQIER